MKDLCVVILNYRRAALTIDCLRALEGEMVGRPERCAVVIDNGSDDGSADELQRAIEERGWSSTGGNREPGIGNRLQAPDSRLPSAGEAGGWLTLIKSPVNGGFAAGNNIGFRAVEAKAYLLLNSDARVTPGSLDQLLESAQQYPEAGLIGPRLEDPDGTPQVSCFRYRTPISEMLGAAATGVLDRLMRRYVVAAGVFEEPVEAEWVSFACILIRRAVIDQVGLMDDGYFMYFEDIDYARKVREHGWKVLHDPRPHVIHLRGGSSSVKSTMKARKRVPRYYYEARSRYFAKHYGGIPGLMLTNFLWLLGRGVSWTRELIGNKSPHTCARETIDNWINWRSPFSTPKLPGGGEL